MEVSKGDKVSFVPEKTSGEDARLARIGIVKFQNGPWVDLMCKGENFDYRTYIDNIIEIHGNVFD